MKKGPIILGILAVLVFLIANSVFIVDERKQALKLQFGQVVGRADGYQEPGLYFKLPFIQNVVYYEDRILPLDTSALEVTPLDDRRLVVDGFARWRIVDPLRFRQAVQNEAAALSRLERVLNAALREVLGSVNSDAILSADRQELMGRIRDAARQSASTLGVQIIDVRIRRADLPQQNLQATFERMQAERMREAADERARGEEAAQRIRANADRQAVELVSEARRESEIIRGQAEAKRNAVFADAFGRDPEFFSFYRSLSAYEKALTGQNSTMVITPDSEFFDYFDGVRSRSAGDATAQAAPSEAGRSGADAMSGSATGDGSGDASGEGAAATPPAANDNRTQSQGQADGQSGAATGGQDASQNGAQNGSQNGAQNGAQGATAAD